MERLLHAGDRGCIAAADEYLRAGKDLEGLETSGACWRRMSANRRPS